MEIVIPWRDTGCPYRRAAFDFVRQHMRGYTLLIADDNSNIFSRAGSKNLGASLAAGEVLFFLDADIVVPHEQIDMAIASATNGIVVAFDRYIYTTRETTAEIIDGKIDPYTAPAQYTASFPVGGAVAISRSIFADGYDTDFVGWGMEDVALVEKAGWAGHSLQKIAGAAVHLWHPGHMRDHNVIQNERLYQQRYLSRETK